MERSWLVRLGRLVFEDFCRLEPFTIRSVIADPDWPSAFLNAPHVELHFRRAGPDRAVIIRPASPEETKAAQDRLVRRYALELLREKAPPLYDCLPWNDWDFSVVAPRVKVFKTRFLLAGAGTTVTVCRLRRAAGVYVVEPRRVIRDYITRKAELEKVRRLTALDATLERIPLPASAADLAIVGGAGLATPTALAELRRVARRLLVVDNDPFAETEPPAGAGERDEVLVRGLGIRAGWWLG